MGSPRFEGFEGAGAVVREGSGLPSTDEDDGLQGRVSSVLQQCSPRACGLPMSSWLAGYKTAADVLQSAFAVAQHY